MSGILEKYHSYLPIDKKFIVTLHEGDTPLLPVPRLAQAIFDGGAIRSAAAAKAALAKEAELPLLYLKLEGLNPTGSFKDRGMTYAVSKAVEAGSRAVICASTGNTSASAAAYAARGGISAFVVIPQGKVAQGKLSQAVIHGARVVAVSGNFDEALHVVRALAAEKLATLVNSLNPYRLEGQKTAAFEICEVLGRAPTHHILPVGNAGNITAYWKGYKEWLGGEGYKESHLPKMLGFQAAGAAPIVLGRPVKKPETIASAIRIGNPASWQQALQARDESGGLIDKVTDREILKAYRMVAQLEGYFCEPASAASIAGLIKYAKQGYFKKEDIIVCTLTGHGLKDPETALQLSVKPIVVRPDLEKVRKALRL